MIQIPVLDTNDSLCEVVLDGETYFLHLSWNEEDAFWTLGIENANHAVLVQSIKVVPDAPLLRWVRRNYLPPGELIASTPDRRDAVSRADLIDGTVPLIYISAEEAINAATL